MINRGYHGVFQKALKLILLSLVISKLVAAQGLESRLSQKSDFVPSATSSKEQLIELAQHHRIPMGIEWINLPGASSPSALTSQLTVRDMIRSILRGTRGYKFEIRAGVLNVFPVALVNSRRNFLNIRIAEYDLNGENVFGAQALLRFNIHRTLHPELYARGWNGGYGYGPGGDDGFDVKNISFAGKNVTVREVLNEIVKQNGNAFWVVDLVPSKMMNDESFFAQSLLGNQDFVWRIIPLATPANVQPN